VAVVPVRRRRQARPCQRLLKPRHRAHLRERRGRAGKKVQVRRHQKPEVRGLHLPPRRREGKGRKGNKVRMRRHQDQEVRELHLLPRRRQDQRWKKGALVRVRARREQA